MKEITSTQNKLVKELVQLREKSKLRRKKAMFLVEGLREISLAKKGSYKINQLYFVPGVISAEKLDEILNLSDVEKIVVSDDVYYKLALRYSTAGVIALVEARINWLQELKFKNKNPSKIIAESTEQKST